MSNYGGAHYGYGSRAHHYYSLIPRPCLGTRLRDGAASLPVDVMDGDLIDFVWLSLHCLECGERFAEPNILCCCEHQMNVLQGSGSKRRGVGGGGRTEDGEGGGGRGAARDQIIRLSHYTYPCSDY